MNRRFLVALVLASATATIGAQSGATTPSSAQPAAPKPDKTLTLTGCVQRDETKAGWFTLSDKKTGATYRLAGTNVKAYVWRNVRIVGGLVPSANIAAQAGAIDPTKAAAAYQGANPPGTGSLELLEFNVARVRPTTGSCAPK